MSRAFDDMQLESSHALCSVRHSAAGRACRSDRADGAGDAPQPVGVTQQLALVQPGAVDEVVVLDAREGQREAIFAEAGRKIRIRQQLDGAALPGAPGTPASMRTAGSSPVRRLR